VALGVAIGTRLADRIAKRNVIFDLHRFTAVMALAFSLCDGSGPYQGVRISISSRMQAGAEGSLTGALSGKMQRLS
ncbi:MAG: hypothetical protein AAB349_03165, partial [Chloroflexota bacterium]